jgi:hypothetical protein
VTTEPIAHTINVQKNKIILDISFNRKKCTNIIPCQQNDGTRISAAICSNCCGTGSFATFGFKKYCRMT